MPRPTRARFGSWGNVVRPTEVNHVNYNRNTMALVASRSTTRKKGRKTATEAEWSARCVDRSRFRRLSNVRGAFHKGSLSRRCSEACTLPGTALLFATERTKQRPPGQAPNWFTARCSRKACPT